MPSDKSTTYDDLLAEFRAGQVAERLRQMQLKRQQREACMPVDQFTMANDLFYRTHIDADGKLVVTFIEPKDFYDGQ